MKVELYVVAFQHPGESLFKADVDVYFTLEEACRAASVGLDFDAPISAASAEFDEYGRWLVSLDDVWCVIFRR